MIYVRLPVVSASFSAFKGAETLMMHREKVGQCSMKTSKFRMDLFFLKKEIVAIQMWSELSAAFSNMAALGNRQTSTVGVQGV